MPTNLLDIPNEILRDVVAVLDRADLKTVRLSCRRLSDTASSFLFKTLYLSCHDPNLHLFEMVSQNPLLLSGVQELVIDDTTVSSALLDRRLYRHLSSQPALWKNRRVPYFPDDENETWDDPGRTWSPTADDELHPLLVYVYGNHHRNRLANSDVAALREALPGMTGLRTLVLSNRTADDSPKEGAQSRDNSSAVVKVWRRMGELRRERPPFPPRVDWWVPLQDDEYEGDEVFETDWLVDGASDYAAHNGVSHLLQSLTAQMDDGHGESEDADDVARSDEESDNVQEHSMTPTPIDNHAVIPWSQAPVPLSARALRRQARGLSIAIDVLRSPMMQSRLTGFRVDASLDTLADTQTPGLSMNLFDFVSPPFALRLSMAFSSMFLTSFALVLSNGRENHAGQNILDQGQVGSVLAEMPRLRKIMIEAHGMATIGAIPDGVTFQELRTAEFACGLVSRLEIRRFLRRHCNLKHIGLLYCSLDDEEPSWSDAVQDVMRLQAMGTTHLRTAVLVSGYETVPFTGCGRNRTKSRPRVGEAVYSWTLGVNEDVIDCPIEQLGHMALPAVPQP